MAEKVCKKCGKTKDLAEFGRNCATKDGLRNQCRVCKRAQDLEALKDPGRYARVQAAGDRYRPRNREKIGKQVRRWQVANPGKMRESVRRKYQRDRAMVYGYYGRACACCGRTENLTISRTDGSSGKRTRLFYARLIREGFPDGYQMMCRSCLSRSGRRGAVKARLWHGATYLGV
jgi:hypothetical protein